MLPAADKNFKNTFKKRDKLKSPLEIEALYRENQFIVSHPLKCYYSFEEVTDNKSNIRAAFSVPKKIFKHAIDRNKLKRRMREAYRLHYKTVFETFINQKEKQLKLFFIYVGKEVLDSEEIVKSLLVILQKINL